MQPSYVSLEATRKQIHANRLHAGVSERTLLNERRRRETVATEPSLRRRVMIVLRARHATS
jgi:hypothetical protein